MIRCERPAHDRYMKTGKWKDSTLMTETNKIILIGWDGATFDIILPMIEAGKMPNTARLMENGAWGNLDSTIPALTPTSWTSISTGVNPGKHGIYDSIIYSKKEQKVSFINATLRRARPVWSILSERGRRVGVVNVPATYPPDQVNGFVISGMFTPSGVSDFIYPPALQQELNTEFGDYLFECRFDKDPEKFLDELIAMVDYRERLSLFLMDTHPCDFFSTFIASDRVQHFYWKYRDPEHPDHKRLFNAIERVYERLDQALGSICQKAGVESTIMIVSDHGAGPLNTSFFLNNWLMKNGYLHFKQDPFNYFQPAPQTPIKTSLKKLIKPLIPKRIRNTIQARKRKAREDRAESESNTFLELIDWEKTFAFSEGIGGGIYINPAMTSSSVNRETIDRKTRQLIHRLSELTGPDGNPVVNAVYRSDDIYTFDQVRDAPDLIVVCSKGYQILAVSELVFFGSYVDELFIPIDGPEGMNRKVFFSFQARM